MLLGHLFWSGPTHPERQEGDNWTAAQLSPSQLPTPKAKRPSYPTQGRSVASQPVPIPISRFHGVGDSIQKFNNK